MCIATQATGSGELTMRRCLDLYQTGIGTIFTIDFNELLKATGRQANGFGRPLSHWASLKNRTFTTQLV